MLCITGRLDQWVLHHWQTCIRGQSGGHFARDDNFYLLTRKQMHKANATAEEASRSIQLALSIPEVNAKILGGGNKTCAMYPIS